jgi:eukaryotic-like serine/threonine-protein kinase
MSARKDDSPPQELKPTPSADETTPQSASPDPRRSSAPDNETGQETEPDIGAPGSSIVQPGASARFAESQLVAGRFRIVRFIGRGGMGEVYEAEDLELRERVALKIVRPEIAADPRSLEHFKREIQLARKVTHPGVCRVFDVFREPGPEGDTIVLSMELLTGETLAERLKQTGRMSTAEAFPLVSQMATALEAAHEAGVVHRDFKTGNVMLVPTARGQRPGVRREEAKTTTAELPTEQLRAVVTDFGLARSVVRAEDPAAPLSATVGIVGTPAYMAPEQVEGGEVTAAADIYALGVVMYEMVTGRHPFISDTPLSTAVKRLKELPPSPRKLVPDLLPQWERAILRCLERKPTDRFANPTDAVKVLTGEVVEVGRRQPEQPNKRRPAWGAATAGLVLAALAAGATSSLIVLPN